MDICWISQSPSRLINMILPVALREFKYWHIDRKTQKFYPWLARKLPTKLKYFVVIDGMVNVRPEGNPGEVRGLEILELWSPEN